MYSLLNKAVLLTHLLLKKSQSTIPNTRYYNPINDDILPSGGSDVVSKMKICSLMVANLKILCSGLFYKTLRMSVKQLYRQQINNFVEIVSFHENNEFISKGTKVTFDIVHVAGGESLRSNKCGARK